MEEGGSPCSANFLVGDGKSGRALSLERAPTGTARVEPQNGFLVDANHFLRGEELGVQEPLAEERRSTYLPQERLPQAAETGPISKEDVEEALRDQESYPDSVCRHESRLFPSAPPPAPRAGARTKRLGSERGQPMDSRRRSGKRGFPLTLPSSNAGRG